MTVAVVTGRRAALARYREARRLWRAVRVRLWSLETVLPGDAEAARLLVPSLARAAADLALFLGGRPRLDGASGMEAVLGAVQGLDQSTLAMAAARLALVAVSDEGAGEVAGSAILAGREFLGRAAVATAVILRRPPLGSLARWLIPLRDNAAVAVLVALVAATAVTAFWPVLCPPSNFDTRMTDLRGIKRLLEQYRRDHGTYPATHAFVGRNDKEGRIEAWIPGLAPSYTRVLPRDPRLDDDPAHQYLYNSDGRDYKLIAHNPEDCETAKRRRPELVDPVRDCRAYGLWTPGAKNW